MTKANKNRLILGGVFLVATIIYDKVLKDKLPDFS